MKFIKLSAFIVALFIVVSFFYLAYGVFSIVLTTL